MTYETYVKDKNGQPIANAIVRVDILYTGKTFPRGSDGNGYSNIYLEDTPENLTAMISVICPGYKNFITYGTTTIKDQVLNIILDSFNQPLWRPTEEMINKYRGAFCIPDAFPDGSDPYGDHMRIWTPALLAYDDSRQDIIIDRYLDFYPEEAHFVINLGGSTYHDDYPHIDDVPSNARKVIIKLLNKHLIPICCATNDEEPDIVLESYKQNADIIDDSFVMWEMNGPCNVPGNPEASSERMFAITKKTCEATPNIKPKLHFTAGHGSMGEPEGEWWKKCAAIGVGGLFSQDDHWDDANYTALGLEDTAGRLKGYAPGYNLLNIGFEQTTTPVYHKYPGWNGTRQRSFGDYLLTLCPHIAGVMDGYNK
jgi:hypothetical protein